MGYLRTLFAISVVLAHAYENNFHLVGGPNAVELFYMISGFLISDILVRQKKYPSTKAFYLGRFFRLYPMYLTVFIITLIPILTMGKGEAFKSVYESAPISAIILLILSNLFIFGQDWVLFTGVENHALIFAKNYNDGDILLANGMPIPQAWTLGIELSFYVIAPFVLPRKYLIVTFLAISIAIRQYLYSIGVGVYRFFPAELAFFLLGALANQFILPHYKKLSKGNGSIYSTLATVYLIIYTIIYPYIPGAEIIKWSILFGSFFFLLPFIFDFQNHHKFDSWIGEYSYPIYIGHMLILWTINALFKNSNIVNSYLFPTICLVLSLLFAGFLYHFIGKPIDIYRKKFAKKRANSRMARAVVKS